MIGVFGFHAFDGAVNGAAFFVGPAVVLGAFKTALQAKYIVADIAVFGEFPKVDEMGATPEG
jgi:hypothetical protein